MTPKLAIQLYTVRDEAAQDFKGVLKKISDIGFAGVELAGLGGLTAKELKNVLDSLGLEICGAHSALPEGADSQRVIDELNTLGCKRCIANSGPPEFATLDAVKAFAARLTAAHSVAAPHGITIGYHNHWWEFEKSFDGKTAYDWLFELSHPAVFAEIDVHWVKTAGIDAHALLQRFGSRCPLVHAKDGPCKTGEPMVAAGKGKVDLKSVLRNSPAQWHVVELDSCATDMMQAVKESFDFLQSQGLGQGRSR